MLTGFPPFAGSSDAEILAKVARGRYCEETLREIDLSEECILFISKLLTVDPEQRISAEEALKDPWILENYQNTMEVQAAENAL